MTLFISMIKVAKIKVWLSGVRKPSSQFPTNQSVVFRYL